MNRKIIYAIVFILAFGFLNTLYKWIESPYIGYLLAALVSILAKVAYDAVEKRISLSKVRYTPSKVTPYSVMGDRGKKEYGFNKDLYCRCEERTVDGNLNQDYKIAVLFGGVGSGKSRAIYEYIKTKGQDKFQYIYIISNAETLKIVREGISLSRKNSLIVIDDVHKFYPDQKENLQKLFESVYKSKYLTAIVTIATENNMGLVVNNMDFFSYLKKLDVVLKRAGEGIKKIEIDEIKRNDEVHRWCLENLRKTSFSPVIGTYIKPLESQISKKTEELFKNEDAVDVLVAYTTIIKFRKDKGQYIRSVFLMYIAQRAYNTTKTLKNFSDGLKALGELGYIKPPKDIKLQCFDHRRVKYDEALSNITPLIEKNQINWGTMDEKIQINDSYLYYTFLAQASLGDKLKTNTTEDYLLYGKDCEIRQVEALIRIDKNNPEYYGRAVTKATYTDEVISLVKHRMFEHLFIQHGDTYLVDKSIINNEEKEDNLATLIAVIIGRSKHKKVEDYQKEIDEYFAMGVVPTINTVGELFRIALYNYNLKDQMQEYVDLLMKKHNIAPSVYYYQRIEELNYGFNAENIRKACLLRQEGLEDIKSFDVFCNAIILKAKTLESLDALFGSVLTTVDNTVPYTITFKKNSLLSLMDNFKNTHERSKSDLIIYLLKKLCASPQRIALEESSACPTDEINSNLQSLFIAAIAKCDKFDKAKQVYDIGLDILNVRETNEKYKRISAMCLFEKIKSINDFLICNEIFLSLKDEEATDADLKLFNKLLDNAPTYELASELFTSAGTINNKCDIYTINALLNVAKKEFKNYDVEKWAREALKVEEYRAAKGILYDAHYFSRFYDIANIFIQDNKQQSSLFEEVKQVISKNKKEINNTVLEAQKIKISTTEAEVLQKAKRVLEDMQKEIVVESDICSHLIKKAEEFNSPEMLEVINEIIENESKINRPKVHYYCNRFKHQLLNGKYNKDETYDLELIKSDIENSLLHLLRIGENLYENNSDVFFSVMTFLDFDAAKDLVLFAKEISKKYSYNYKFEKLFRSDLIICLTTRIAVDDSSMSKKQVGEIQLLINNNPTLKFNGYQRRTISAVAKKSRFFIYYPLTNPNKTVRYHYWDNEMEEGRIHNAFENDIQTFIKLDVYDIACNLNRQEKLGDTRIIQALEVLSEKTDRLEPFVNKDGFLTNRFRSQEAVQFNHFFEAFWYLYAFKPEHKKKWKNLAAHYGYMIAETKDKQGE